LSALSFRKVSAMHMSIDGKTCWWLHTTCCRTWSQHAMAQSDCTSRVHPETTQWL